MAPIPRPPNPNLRSTTPAIDRPAHVLIATILFIERRRWGRPRNAILREHPRHDREHAPGQAAENHGGRPRLALAKLEMMNPGGSVKDPNGEKMIEDAEAKGLLKPRGAINQP